MKIGLDSLDKQYVSVGYGLAIENILSQIQDRKLILMSGRQGVTMGPRVLSIFFYNENTMKIGLDSLDKQYVSIGFGSAIE